MNIDTMIASRTLPIEFTIELDNGTQKKLKYELKAMKLKNLRKLFKLQKEGTENAVVEMVRLILSSNTMKRKVPDEFIEAMTTDQMVVLGQQYTEWISQTQKN